MSKFSNMNSLDINGNATHQIVIDFEDGKQRVFAAKISFNEEDFRLYKVNEGDIEDETFVEVGDGAIRLLIEGEEYEFDILDSIIDGADLHFWCEDESCNSIEIDASCVVKNEDERQEIANSLLHDEDMWDDEDDYEYE